MQGQRVRVSLLSSRLTTYAMVAHARILDAKAAVRPAEVSAVALLLQHADLCTLTQLCPALAPCLAALARFCAERMEQRGVPGGLHPGKCGRKVWNDGSRWGVQCVIMQLFVSPCLQQQVRQQARHAALQIRQSSAALVGARLFTHFAPGPPPHTSSGQGAEPGGGDWCVQLQRQAPQGGGQEAAAGGHQPGQQPGQCASVIFREFGRKGLPQESGKS